MDDIWSDNNIEPSVRKKATWTACFCIFLIVNVASSQGWLGATNAEVSAKFKTVLTPQGWTFSIWGLIFLLQAAGTWYTISGSGYDPDGYKQRYVNGLYLPLCGFWVSCSLWQFMFVQESVLCMMLAACCILSGLICIGKGMMTLYGLQNSFGIPDNAMLYFVYMLPTSVGTAWMAVASAVQILIALVTQFPDQIILGMLFLLVTAACGVWMLFRHKDTAFGLTLLWAFVGIYEGTASGVIRHTTVAAIVCLVLGVLASVLRRKNDDRVELVDSEFRQPLTAQVDASGDMA